MCVCPCVTIYIDARGQYQIAFLQHHLHFSLFLSLFLRWGLELLWNLSSRLESWLKGPWDPLISTSSVPGLWCGKQHHAWFLLCGFWGCSSGPCAWKASLPELSQSSPLILSELVQLDFSLEMHNVLTLVSLGFYYIYLNKPCANPRDIHRWETVWLVLLV